METFAIDKQILKDTYKQLTLLKASHEKNLEKLKYNLPYKSALKSEIKKINELLTYYEQF